MGSLSARWAEASEQKMNQEEVTWLHLRTHHLWRTIKEVGLLSEDHLPQSMTQPVQLLIQNQEESGSATS